MVNINLKKHEKLKKLYSLAKNQGLNYGDLSEEQILLIKSSSHWSYNFCNSIFKKDIPGFTEVFEDHKSTRYSYKYARFVRRSRIEELEPIIALSAKYSFNYARFVVKGRFVLGETSILKSQEFRDRYLTLLKRLKNYEDVQSTQGR